MTQMRGGASAADIFTLIDVHPDFMHQPEFAITLPTDNSNDRWITVPSKQHGKSCAIAFADGHAEMHHWLNSRLIPACLYVKVTSAQTASLPWTRMSFGSVHIPARPSNISGIGFLLDKAQIARYEVVS